MNESTTLPIAGTMALGDDPLTDILRRGARTLLARSVEAEVTAYLQERSHLKAEAAFDLFISTYGAKCPKADECLTRDWGSMLAFNDFPAEHWRHIRTTNPIESTFTTVLLRYDKTEGNGSRVACLTMVFKLMEAASKKWRLLNGLGRLKEMVRGVKFVDGIEEKVAA